MQLLGKFIALIVIFVIVITVVYILFKITVTMYNFFASKKKKLKNRK